MTEPGGRLPFAAYRQRLAALGFHPSRSLGQNFLLDPTLHRAVVDAAEIGPDDLVVEIGAGLGFLTRELVERCPCVLAVELDRRLHQILQEDLVAHPRAQRVRLHRGDALAGNQWSAWLCREIERELVAMGGRHWCLVANLPYGIAGPLLASTTTLTRPPRRASVLVQLEMAERLTAAPGTPAYGGIGVVVGASYRARLLRRVGREVFRPRPAVDSALVVLGEAPSSLLVEPVESRAEFAAFVRHLFASRRKQMANAVGRACSGLGWPQPEISSTWATRRPEELSALDLVAIWRQVRRSP